MEEKKVNTKISSVSYTHLDVYKRQPSHSQYKCFCCHRIFHKKIPRYINRGRELFLKLITKGSCIIHFFLGGSRVGMMEIPKLWDTQSRRRLLEV